jgi:Transposase
VGGCVMPPRRKFSHEFRERAVATVTETSRPIAQVARELDLNPATLGNWVRMWRKEQVGPSSAPGGLADSWPSMGPRHPAPRTLAAPLSADNFDLGDNEASDPTGSVTTSTARVSRHRLQLSTAMTIATNIFLYLILANPVSLFLLTIFFELTLATVLSQAARESLHSTLYGLLLIGGLFISFDIAASFYKKSMGKGRFLRIFFGKPSLGRLGGTPEAVFRLAMQMHKQFSVKAAPEDEEVISNIQSLDRDYTESVFRAKYISERQSDGVQADQASREWKEIQWKRVLSRSYDGVSLEDTYSKSLVWQVFIPRLTSIGQRIGPLISVGLIVSIWLFARGIRTENYLPALQVVLLAGFLVTTIVFANVTYGFSFVQWQTPSKDVVSRLTDETLRSRVAEYAARYSGQRFWPAKVTFGERYAQLVSSYFTRSAGAILSFYAAATLCILLICAAVDALGSGPESYWYYHMAVALVVIPGLLFLAIYGAFVILRTAGSLTGVVIAALILAVAPLILTFVFTGKSPGKGDLTTSIVAGLAGALATAVADRTKDRVQRAKH